MLMLSVFKIRIIFSLELYLFKKKKLLNAVIFSHQIFLLSYIKYISNTVNICEFFPLPQCMISDPRFQRISLYK